MILKVPYLGEITAQQVTTLVLLGMLTGATFTSHFVPHSYEHFLKKNTSVVEVETPNEEALAPVIYSKKMISCNALCHKPPEKVVEPPKPLIRKSVPGTTPVAALPKKIKNPNAIRISLAEAPTILAEVKKVNGRSVCAKKNDKGRKSKKMNSVHIDRECCLDPDEIPNPRCLYK